MVIDARSTLALYVFDFKLIFDLCMFRNLYSFYIFMTFSYMTLPMVTTQVLRNIKLPGTDSPGWALLRAEARG